MRGQPGMNLIRVVKTAKSYRLDSRLRVIDVQQANQFLQALEHRALSTQTVRSYSYDLACFLGWLHGMKAGIKDLNQRLLLEFVGYQQQQRAAARSINRRLACCRCFYRFCFDTDVPRSPGSSQPAPYYRGPGLDRSIGIFNQRKKERLVLKVKVPKHLIETLQPEEVNAFSDRLVRYRDCVIVQLMLMCGLRSCEVLALRCEDVDFRIKQVRITGKGNKQRMVPLPDALIKNLQKYLLVERPGAVPSKRRPTSGDRLLVILQGKHRGQPMSGDGLRSLFRHRRLRLGLSKANAHRFRHTCATDLARSGMSLPVLQKLLGHADPAMTLHYIQLSMTDISAEYTKAMERIHSRYDKS